MPYFERYLKEGYYPFYNEEASHYAERIVKSVNQTLESDWPAVENVTAETVRKARKMLRILAELPPQTPKMNALYDQLDTVRPQGLKILYALERAGLIKLLAAERVAAGVAKRWPNASKEINDRIAFELSVFETCGRVAYHLKALRCGGTGISEVNLRRDPRAAAPCVRTADPGRPRLGDRRHTDGRAIGPANGPGDLERL